jgi:hypothetical protein
MDEFLAKCEVLAPGPRAKLCCEVGRKVEVNAADGAIAQALQSSNTVYHRLLAIYTCASRGKECFPFLLGLATAPSDQPQQPLQQQALNMLCTRLAADWSERTWEALCSFLVSTRPLRKQLMHSAIRRLLRSPGRNQEVCSCSLDACTAPNHYMGLVYEVFKELSAHPKCNSRTRSGWSPQPAHVQIVVIGCHHRDSECGYGDHCILLCRQWQMPWWSARYNSVKANPMTNPSRIN